MAEPRIHPGNLRAGEPMTRHTPAMTQPVVDAPARRSGGQIAAMVVAALAMIVVGWVFLVSGLVMPGWAVAALLVIWAGLVVVGVRLARSGSYAVLAIPIVAAAIWLLALWLGDVFLDWTA